MLLVVLAVSVLTLSFLNFLVGSYHVHLLSKGFGSTPLLSSSEVSMARRSSVTERPPLESLVQGWNVTGDISFLLDFAVVGFPKCGTSSLMYQLKNHSQVDIFTDERCDMAYNKQVLLAKDLYKMNPTHFRGLKCPMDIESTPLGLPNYHKYFPHTKFIVGIRHPVLWFESFYNFRVHNGFALPPPSEMMGRCRKNMKNVCTFRGNFHVFLANLGKTQVRQHPYEMKWFEKSAQRSVKPLNDTNVNRQVFLYEVSQLSDPKTSRSNQFLADLQHFLGLPKPFPNPMIWFRPGKQHTSEEQTIKAKSLQINICDKQHSAVRDLLQAQAVNASEWIGHYFLRAPGVTVSSPQYFLDTILAKWKKDPCTERNKRGR